MPWFTMYSGIHKTGSSAIHKSLATNRKELLSQGLLYPHSPGGFNNHHGFANLVVQSRVHRPLYSPTLKRELRHWELDLWARAVLMSDRLVAPLRRDLNVLVAAEQFSALSRPSLLRLFSHLRPYWRHRTPRALMWVREPVELFRSLALQRLKGSGRLVSLPFDPLKQGTLFHSGFEEFFSVEPQVYLYDSRRYREQSVVPDFLAALDESLELPAAQKVSLVNRSISPEAGYVFNKILSSEPEEADAVKEARRVRLVRQIVVETDLKLYDVRPSARLSPLAKDAVASASKNSWEYFASHGIDAVGGTASIPPLRPGSPKALETFESEFRDLDDEGRIKLVFEIDDNYVSELEQQFSSRVRRQ